MVADAVAVAHAEAVALAGARAEAVADDVTMAQAEAVARAMVALEMNVEEWTPDRSHLIIEATRYASTEEALRVPTFALTAMMYD